jgi:hypothetical protein
MKPLRYEVKMTCSDLHLPNVRAWVNLHPETFIEAYPPRRVNSVYFDTYEVGCLDQNLIGISERAKARFRWYGEDCSRVEGVLELKRKANQLGRKELFPVPVPIDLGGISWSDFMQRLREQLSGSAAVWMAGAEQPTLITRYMREYYESRDHQVRLTIDYDQVAYEQITHSTPNLEVRAPIPSLVVVEVKAEEALYRRVSNVLSSLPLQVGRNSKYVNGVLDSFCFL